MKLIDVLRKECVIAGAQFSDKADVLNMIVGLAKKSPILKDVPDEEILTGLQERESLGSTGFGKGIAIPHCRLKSVKDFVVGLITVPLGVEFESLDGEKVRLIIFIIAPQEKANRHLKLLSAISQTLLIPGVVEEVLTEQSAEAVYESFLRHTRAEIDGAKQTTKCRLDVFIQDENTFHEILEKLTGIETSNFMVAHTENVAAYLSKTPLFAGFWHDESGRFSKVIIGVLDKGLTNEAIRRIESVTGDLGKFAGVMVTVTDISYVAGSI
jgi:PTS system nitrogen regulatory IIA component